MNLPLIRKILRWYIRNSDEAPNPHVSLLGGEPLLNLECAYEIAEILKKSSTNKRAIKLKPISTNATILNEKK